jgi:hypothetical protein
MSYKIIDLPALGRTFNATDIIEVSADGTGSYKANIGNFTLGGENYIFVNANGTPLENGQALRNAYATATAMTPNGVAKSATNRVIILLAPGYYDFDEASSGDFYVTESFIDLESLSGFADVYFSSIYVISSGTGKNIYLAGINTTKNSYLPTGPFVLQTTGGVNEFIYIKNCVGGDYSFGAYCGGFNGVIEDCSAGSYSFGYISDNAPVGINFLGVNPTNYGVYRNCFAGNSSFLSSDATLGGGEVTNFGTIENCQAGTNSFLYAYDDNVNNSGTIYNCKSTGSESFVVGQLAATALLNNGLIASCIGTESSFVVIQSVGAFAENLGKIIECTVSGDSCFVINTASPTGGRNYGFISNCNAYNTIMAFCGRQGSNYGFINNCIASTQSFCCQSPLNIFEDIYRCTMTNDLFVVGTTGGGRVVLGIDNSGVVNY